MDVHFLQKPLYSRPSPEAVKVALAHLLASADLRVSERNRRFLAFVVSETLEGRAERIKAYSIGVDVFGRCESFDPSSDPIVRIEATRLRAALATYYEGRGAGDPVRISMPPGSYIPTFDLGAASTAEARQPEVNKEVFDRKFSETRHTAIFVKHHTDPRDRPAAVRNELLIDSIIARLSKLALSIFVMPLPELCETADSAKSPFKHPESMYALDVGVHSLTDRMRYTWCVTDLQSGQLKCFESFDRSDKGIPGAAMIDELAEYAVKSVTDALP